MINFGIKKSLTVSDFLKNKDLNRYVNLSYLMSIYLSFISFVINLGGESLLIIPIIIVFVIITINHKSIKEP